MTVVAPDDIESESPDIVRPFPRTSVAKRARRALGIGWFYPAGRIPFPQRVLRRLLERLASRYRLFLTLSMLRPEAPITQRLFTRNTPLMTHLDFVRYATAELICRQIRARSTPGALAELGVYQGFWARVVNHHLPERKLYLFDTFTGFDRRDLARQADLGLSAEPPYEVGPIDPLESVRHLTHPEQAVVRAGWFPATVEGLERESFCYVDIDTGLYEPTLAGLRWFYPRLSPGGYINVVDYNNTHTRGVKLAVDEFADQVGLGFTVSPDVGASATFVKPRR
jgi:O-methyltransferase